MLTLTDAAVDAIRLASSAARPAVNPTIDTAGHTDPGPMRLVSPAGPPTGGVHLEPAGDPTPGDVVVSRGGATIYLDRELAAQLHHKTLHAHAATDSTASVAFTLLDQP